MKKRQSLCLFIVFLIMTTVLLAVPHSHMSLIGRWGSGSCRAAFSGSYLFVGNGAILDVYQVEGPASNPVITQQSSILLPDMVNDIFVLGNDIYVACDDAGLQILQNPTDPSIVGVYDTNGKARSVVVFLDTAYVADGTGGLVILDVSTESNPKKLSIFPTSGSARDVLVDGDTAYVAVDTAGFWTVDVSDKSNPSLMDTVHTPGVVKNIQIQRPNVIVADGEAGITIVDISDPHALAVNNTWAPGSARDITDVFIQLNRLYASDALAGVRVIDDIFSSPSEIATMATRGSAERIVLNASNTAFVADGGGGLMVLDISNPSTPVRVDSILTGGFAKDILLGTETVYVAGGHSGLWILDRTSFTETSAQVIAHIDTFTSCFGLALQENLLFVADGVNGLTILDVTSPETPVWQASIAVTDTAFAVEVYGDSVFVADGAAGLHIFGIVTPSAPTDVNTVGLGGKSAYGVRIDPDRELAYMSTGSGGVVLVDNNLDQYTFTGSADSHGVDFLSDGDSVIVADGINGLLLYDVADSTNPILRKTIQTSGEAYDILTQENTAFIADGEGTVRMFDFSGTPSEVGSYHTAGRSVAVDIDEDTIAVADGHVGVYIVEPEFIRILTAIESSLDFDEVIIEYSGERRLRLRNTGTLPVWISNITSNTGRFVPESTVFVVNPGQKDTLSVTFNPLYDQTVNDTLIIYSNASNSPLRIPVRGVGIERLPLTAYIPDYYAYSLLHFDVLDGDTLLDGSDYGYLDARVTGASLTSSGGGRFGEALQFDGSDYVEILLDSLDFLPDFDGFSVDMWFWLDAVPDGRRTLFQLTEGPQIFFELAVDDTMPGRRGLSARSMPTLMDTVYLSSGTTFTLPLNEWMHAALTFDDSLRLFLNGVLVDTRELDMDVPYGSLVATIGNTVAGGDAFPGSIDEFRMSGSSRESWEFPQTVPSIISSVATLDFGNVRVGQSSMRTVEFSNHGYQTLSVADIEWQNDAFSVVDTNFQVVSEGSELDSVLFSPGSVSVYRDTLLVISNDPDSDTLRIPIVGMGVNGPILNAESFVNFGEVLVGEVFDLALEITNDGDETLIITDIDWDEDVFAVSDTTDTLIVGETEFIALYFEPEQSGLILDTLSLISNDPVNPIFQIMLEGTGIAYRDKESYTADEYTVVLYNFEGTNDTLASDSTPDELDARFAGGVTRIGAGYFGKALRFDGSDGMMSVPLDAEVSFDMTADSFTVECFFRTDTVSHALFFKDFWGGSEGPNYGLSIDEMGRFDLYGFGTGETRVNDGAWHHVAFVYEGGAGRGSLYLDGELELQEIRTAGMHDTDMPSRLVWGAREYDSTTTVNYFQGELDEVRVSNVARKTWEFAFEVTDIDVFPTAEAFVGVEYTVQIELPSEPYTTSLSFNYRQGGQSAFSSVDATEVDSTTYTVTVPASAMTLRGLEYYIVQRTTEDTLTYPLYDPIRKPMTVSARFAQSTRESVVEAMHHTIVSVPFELDESDVEDVLNDDLGVYHPYRWRFFAWNDTGYAEFSDSLATADTLLFEFNRGNAFWLITNEDRAFDTDSGMTASTESAFQFTLKPQWNMIGSPFPFPVAWDDCSLASDSIGTLYAYNGRGYRLDWPTFEPWLGYWIYNTLLVNTSFTVPPRETALAKRILLPRNGVLFNLGDTDWIWRFSAVAEGAEDLDNFAGIRADAQDGWDIRDRFEPPPIGDYVSLYFDHSDWDMNPGHYAADIRSPGRDGYTWDFFVESPLQGQPIVLSWNLNMQFPEEWVSYLIDVKEGVSIDLMKNTEHTFMTGNQVSNSQSFQLLTGSQHYVENHCDIPLVPVEFNLQQNYPNPFNPETTIEYSLPKNGSVTLTIHNVLGQRIRTLIDQKQKTGHHQVVWDGHDDAGSRVASGMYFCRIVFPGHAATRKLILIR